MEKPSWQATVVAIAIIALVGVMFWRAADGDFAEVWAGVGTIVGVVTGAIPSFFFRAQAKDSLDKADKASRRAEAYASAATPDSVAQMKTASPEVFD